MRMVADRLSGDGPLVGRDDERERIAGALTAVPGSGVLLVGRPGVGKSRLAAAALDDHERAGVAVVRLAATPGWREVPFGAVVDLLPGAALGVTDVFREVERRLHTLAAGRPVVVGIDDLHFLDNASAALLERLMIGGAVHVLAGTLDSTIDAPPVALLRRAGALARVEVPPLAYADFRDLVSALLDGPADGLTLDALWRLTLGNPLFVREVLRAGFADATLRRENGMWHWRSEHLGTPGLPEVVGLTVGALTATESSALAYVAYGAPVPLSLLERLVPAEVTEQLEERGLIRLDQSGQRTVVRLGHPLYGEAARARTGALRTRRILRELADALEPETAGAEDRIQVVSWRVEAGFEVDEAELLATATEALRRGGAALALRLAERVPTAAGAWHAGRALVALGRHQEADERLRRGYAEMDVPGDRAQAAALRALNMFWGLRRPDDALRVLDDAGRTLPAGVCHELLSAQAGIAVFCGRGHEALATIATALEQPSQDPLLATAIAPLRPYVMVFAGAPAQVAASFAAGDPALPEVWPTMRAATQTCHVQALVMAGRITEATEAAERYYGDAVAHGSPDGVGLLAMARGICAGERGQVDAASRWIHEALAVTDSATLFPIRVKILAMQAWWAAHQRRFDEGWAAIEEVARLVPDGSDAGDYARLSKAWLLAMSGEPGRAVALLRELTDAFLAGGLMSVGMDALHLWSRLEPSTAVAREARRIADLCDTPLFEWYADYAEALAAPDPLRLEEISQRWEDQRYDLLALEAAVHAARCDPPDGRTASRLARRVERLRQECAGFWPAWLDEPDPAGPLTPREREVAALAAAGLGNPEIAERLVLSVRTVENHLQRAYGKLGIRDRRELAAAIGAPAAPAAGR
ncbi:LuxR C-terminal-related transcriptional regulator [Polymorphospora rubra]|uniref:LuxR C-terminal-related transcriptional regulator n=1 Tax=Polymorphospora rubra TaxID=338584 RepID=UPI0033D83E22